MALADVDWIEKGVTWAAALAAAVASWVAKKAYGHVKRVEALEKAVALMESNHTERKAALATLGDRLEGHIAETQKGFSETRVHIDNVTTSIKDDVRAVLNAVLSK